MGSLRFIIVTETQNSVGWNVTKRTFSPCHTRLWPANLILTTKLERPTLRGLFLTLGLPALTKFVYCLNLNVYYDAKESCVWTSSFFSCLTKLGAEQQVSCLRSGPANHNAMFLKRLHFFFFYWWYNCSNVDFVI